MEQRVIRGMVLKEAFLMFLSQGGLGCARLSPFLRIIGNLFVYSQALSLGLHLLSLKCSRVLEAVRQRWQSAGAVFGI